MATKNFLFFLIILVQLTACNIVTKRSRVEEKAAKKEEAKTEAPKEEVKPVEEPRPERKDKSVGLILGPGGMKVFAHLGVLKEFEKAKIPIKAVVGLEMGSLIGAFYAAGGSANEAEWKLFKMRDEDVMEKSFFQAKDKLSPVSRILDFTKRELGSKSINEFRRLFGCVSISMKDEKPLISDGGNIVNALKNCVPYPPLFRPSGDRVAGVTYIKEAADYLRSNGVDAVVLVNVLAGGKLMSDDDLMSQPALGNLWIQIRKNLAEAESQVDYVISVDTKGMGINDFEMHRSLVQAGSNDGRYHVGILANKYGF